MSSRAPGDSNRGGGAGAVALVCWAVLLPCWAVLLPCRTVLLPCRNLLGRVTTRCFSTGPCRCIFLYWISKFYTLHERGNVGETRTFLELVSELWSMDLPPPTVILWKEKKYLVFIKYWNILDELNVSNQHCGEMIKLSSTSPGFAVASRQINWRHLSIWNRV